MLPFWYNCHKKKLLILRKFEIYDIWQHKTKKKLQLLRKEYNNNTELGGKKKRKSKTTDYINKQNKSETTVIFLT